MIKIDENDPVGELEPSFPFRNVVIKKNTDVKKFYDLQKEIGRGKFGTVFKCRERSTGFKLAAKFISIAQRQDRRNAEREVEIMRELQHPRLIQIYDAYEMNNIMCVVLELIEGGELFERVIDDDFVLTEKSVSVFMRQICEGVAFIHSKNILHLDMKPENILCLTREGNRIKIIDFGLARKYDPEKKLQVLFGTPEFVAPEVVNFDSIGFGTDMWSVGVICYVLLSGLSPFMGETDVATMANVTIAQYDFDDEAFNDISKDAQDFISKLLLKDKEDRMSATDCLSHPWLKRIPPPPTAKVNGNENQIINNELDLQKDVLRGIVDRWNCDINGDDNGKSKIIEFNSMENGISDENPKPAVTKEEPEAKKKPKRQTSLPNGNGPPPRRKEGDPIKLITKGVVTGLVSGFEPKKVTEKPKERCKMNGEIKKLNGFGDIHNKFLQNSIKVNKTEEPLRPKNEPNKQSSDSKLPAPLPTLAKVSNHVQDKSTPPTEKVADTKSPADVLKNVSSPSNSEEKKPMNDSKLKNEVPNDSKESNGTSKLPNINNTHSSPQNKNILTQSSETSQNFKATVRSQNCNSEKVTKEKVELNGTSTDSSTNPQNAPDLTSPTKLPEKTVANEKTEIIQVNLKTDSNSTQSTTTENKPKSSPKPQKKSATSKSSTDETKPTGTSTVPQSTNDAQVAVKISKVSKSEIDKSLASSEAVPPSRDPSPNTLSPHSPKSETPKSKTSKSPTPSRTSPAKTDTSPARSPSRSKKKSIQVEEDDDSFQSMKKRNVLIQNIIENYEQKAQKANADSRRPSNMTVDDLLDGDQLVDFFNAPKLTQRRISDITSLLSGSDNVERSIEEMKAFCKNLSQMVRFRQDSINEGDAKNSSKRPKFRISCFSRDVPMMNSSGPCSSNLFNYVPWYDEELSNSWNLAKSNTHSDPGSLRNSPEPLAPPSLTRKILSKFFNNSIEYGMAGVPSSQHAAPKDKVAEILS